MRSWLALLSAFLALPAAADIEDGAEYRVVVEAVYTFDAEAQRWVLTRETIVDQGEMPDPCANADVNRDGVIGAPDYLAVVACW